MKIKEGSVNISLIVKIALSVVIFVLLFYKIGIQKILENFKEFNLIYLIPIFALYFILHLLNTYCVYIMLVALKVKVPFLRLLRYFLIGFGLGFLSVGRVGELAMPLLLKKDGTDYGKSFPAIIMDKILTFIPLIIIAVAGVSLFFKGQSFKIDLIIIAISLLAIFLLFSGFGRGIVKKYVLGKHQKKFRGFSKNLFSFLGENKGYTLLNFIITLVKLVGIVWLNKLLFLGFSTDVGFFEILVVYCISVLVSYAPITVGGFGVKEASSVFLFTLLGINAAKVGGVELGIFLIRYIQIALIFLFLIKKEDFDSIKWINKNNKKSNSFKNKS